MVTIVVRWSNDADTMLDRLWERYPHALRVIEATRPYEEWMVVKGEKSTFPPHCYWTMDALELVGVRCYGEEYA